MPAQNVLLYIKSEPYRKVILVQSEHGTISADRTEGKEGDLVKLTAEPEPGYVLDSWYLTVTDSLEQVNTLTLSITPSRSSGEI